MTSQTADHYSKQWDPKVGFADFVAANPDAWKNAPSERLPWRSLYASIREKALKGPVRVYDAACGFGDLMKALFVEPVPAGLSYVGADIHEQLGSIPRPSDVRFVQHDVTTPLDDGLFDFIACREAIHHTPDPPATYRVLAAQLAPGGVLAITTYAKKAPMREAIDDAMRALVVPMSTEEAWKAASQFTTLGKALQAVPGEVEIPEDLPLLGIKAGRYAVQDFIYRHFMKCWHNTDFSPEHCDLVNFDWYHPPYAFRYDAERLESWANWCGLVPVRAVSIDTQHYLEARRPV